MTFPPGTVSRVGGNRWHRPVAAGLLALLLLFLLLLALDQLQAAQS